MPSLFKCLKEKQPRLSVESIDRKVSYLILLKANIQLCAANAFVKYFSSNVYFDVYINNNEYRKCNILISFRTLCPK